MGDGRGVKGLHWGWRAGPATPAPVRGRRPDEKQSEEASGECTPAGHHLVSHSQPASGGRPGRWDPALQPNKNAPAVVFLGVCSEREKKSLQISGLRGRLSRPTTLSVAFFSTVSLPAPPTAVWCTYTPPFCPRAHSPLSLSLGSLGCPARAKFFHLAKGPGRIQRRRVCAKASRPLTRALLTPWLSPVMS